MDVKPSIGTVGFSNDLLCMVKVGVWTKADSVTLFDHFAYEGSCN